MLVTSLNAGFGHYRIEKYSFLGQPTKSYDDSAFIVIGQVGGRYFILKNVGINFEINGGVINNNRIRGGISFIFYRHIKSY